MKQLLCLIGFHDFTLDHIHNNWRWHFKCKKCGKEDVWL